MSVALRTRAYRVEWEEGWERGWRVEAAREKMEWCHHQGF